MICDLILISTLSLKDRIDQDHHQIKLDYYFLSSHVPSKGFEKMERGLSEKYNDRESPVRRHMDHMVKIGAEPGLVSPQLNTMTSDVIKVNM